MIGTYLYVCYADFRDRAIFLGLAGMPEQDVNIYYQAIFSFVTQQEAMDSGRLVVAGLRIKLGLQPFVFECDQGENNPVLEKIIDALKTSDGTPTGAAQVLNKNVAWVSKYLKKHNVDWRPFRDQAQKQQIIDALIECDGDRKAAARLLNISFNTVYDKIDKFQIDIPRQNNRIDLKYVKGIDVN